MTIRRATLEDASAIVRLSGDLGYTTTLDGTRDRLARLLASSMDAVFVAEATDGEVIGWVHVFAAIRLESERFAEIGGFVVSEACRGSGIGTGLLAVVENWAVDRSLPVLRVRSQSRRREARLFYRNRGFSESKEQRVLDKRLVSGTLPNNGFKPTRTRRSIAMKEQGMVDYVEFPARDLQATKTFFSQVFGWSFQDYGSDYTAFSSQGIGGGFYRSDKSSSTERGAGLVVFYSDDLEASQVEIERAGGVVCKPIFSFPGGRRFQFIEPSGNEFAVWSDH